MTKKKNKELKKENERNSLGKKKKLIEWVFVRKKNSDSDRSKNKIKKTKE